LNALRYDIANTKGCSSNYRTAFEEEENQVQQNPITLASELMVYPNPSSTQFNIKLNIEEGSTAKITVMNAGGQTVLNTDVNSDLIYDYRIETADWPEGLYMICVQSNGKVWSEKIIVKH
ncbi:MAG: T9SS type A sorting domain-containing protein, partial [Bacteroidia bacterium]